MNLVLNKLTLRRLINRLMPSTYFIIQPTGKVTLTETKCNQSVKANHVRKLVPKLDDNAFYNLLENLTEQLNTVGLPEDITEEYIISLIKERS